MPLKQWVNAGNFLKLRADASILGNKVYVVSAKTATPIATRSTRPICYHTAIFTSVRLRARRLTGHPPQSLQWAILIFPRTSRLVQSWGSSITDPDGDAITYSFGSYDWQTYHHLFSIDSNGTLRTAVELNYEWINLSKKIRVVATDEDGESVSELFSVTIINENDAPVADSSSLVFSVSENEPWNLFTWDRTYGGIETDYTGEVIPAHDGGYLFAGTSNSSPSGNKSANNLGKNDFWLVKTDEGGNKIWDVTYGGSGDDNCSGLIQTTDGNYLLFGSSDSPAGGGKTESSQGKSDFWIVKIDQGGSKIWDKRYGGALKDQCLLAIELGNGDFILGGRSGSGMDGDKSQWNMGHTDGWLLRVDQYGNKIWDQSYGGNGWDELEEIGLLPDGNLLIFADSTSPSGSYKNSNTNGVNDYWALKVNAGNGAIIWDKSYGGINYDYLDHGVLHDDGSFVMVGLSYDGSANTGDRQSSAVGQKDLWVVRADANGSILWEKSFGGESSVGWESRILGLSDGSYVLSTNIHGGVAGDVSEPSKGGAEADYWILKIDGNGNKIWDRRYGEQAMMVHAVLSPHRMVDFC